MRHVVILSLVLVAGCTRDFALPDPGSATNPILQLQPPTPGVVRAGQMIALRFFADRALIACDAQVAGLAASCGQPADNVCACSFAVPTSIPDGNAAILVQGTALGGTGSASGTVTVDGTPPRLDASKIYIARAALGLADQVVGEAGAVVDPGPEYPDQGVRFVQLWAHPYAEAPLFVIEPAADGSLPATGIPDSTLRSPGRLWITATDHLGNTAPPQELRRGEDVSAPSLDPTLVRLSVDWPGAPSALHVPREAASDDSGTVAALNAYADPWGQALLGSSAPTGEETVLILAPPEGESLSTQVWLEAEDKAGNRSPRLAVSLQRVLWARSFGTAWPDPFPGAATLADGSVALVGSHLDPLDLGGLVLPAGFGMEGAAVAFGPSGTPQWALSIPGRDVRLEVVLGLPDGSFFVAGRFFQELVLGAGTPEEVRYSIARRGGFAARLEASGRLRWAQRLEVADTFEPRDATLLADGSIVLTGSFMGLLTFDPDGLAPTVLDGGGQRDPFVARFGADGTLAFALREGGLYDDEARAVTALSDGGFAVTGHFEYEATFAAGTSAETTLDAQGFAAGYLARYGADGALRLAIPLRGGTTYGKDVLALSDDTLVVAGVYYGQLLLDGAGEALQAGGVGGDEAWVAAFDQETGAARWLRTVSGAGHDRAVALTRLADDRVVVLGSFRGRAYLEAPGPDAPFLSSAGEQDLFLASFRPDGSRVWAIRAGGERSETPSQLLTLGDQSLVVTGSFEGLLHLDPALAPLVAVGMDDVFVARLHWFQ